MRTPLPKKMREIRTERKGKKAKRYNKSMAKQNDKSAQPVSHGLFEGFNVALTCLRYSGGSILDESTVSQTGIPTGRRCYVTGGIRFVVRSSMLIAHPRMLGEFRRHRNMRARYHFVKNSSPRRKLLKAGRAEEPGSHALVSRNGRCSVRSWG